MALSDYVHTFGQAIKNQYGERIHKLAIDADFTCPNRDGTKGTGGCTFCNNSSFSPNGRQPKPLEQQIEAGRQVIRKRTRANKYMAYFQAYTNTYADVNELKTLYDRALAEEDVIGLSIGTRPDCLPEPVVELLHSYQRQGYEIWLELGLQSSSNETLQRVNRGHSYEDYCDAVNLARQYKIKVCTHLIAGLPGETGKDTVASLLDVLGEGVDGLKIHPLHVVKGTALANEWRNNEYEPLGFNDYIQTVANMVEMTPYNIIFHRLTGTASENILLAPQWCSKKWYVLNSIERELIKRGSYQGSALENKVYGCSQ
ncbi:MAG: TIGR01212 family radical SAM protein [Gammaproteobacteria bacterium]|nr:TIGR01212 family radical SAM protein [Gammaproteobacteria bacterium]